MFSWGITIAHYTSLELYLLNLCDMLLCILTHMNVQVYTSHPDTLKSDDNNSVRHGSVSDMGVQPCLPLDDLQLPGITHSGTLHCLVRLIFVFILFSSFETSVIILREKN